MNTQKVKLLKYQNQSTFIQFLILHKCNFHVSELCILPPWRWPRVWPKYVADHYVYNCLIYLRVLIIKPTWCTNFSNLFWHETLHVSDSSCVYHQEFFTVHTAMVYVIQVCRQLASKIRMELSSILILLASCQQTCMTYTIAVCTVNNSWWWTEELSETCTVLFQK